MSGVSLRLSVVVCAYTGERWDDLTVAVGSLAAQQRPVDEIVLVIDHNAELLARARARFDGVVVVPNGGPRGLSGARNTGWSRATGDVVAFMDDDAAADPEWSERLLAAYDEQVIGVGGGVLPVWRAPRPSWFPDEFLWVVGCGYRGQPTTRSPVRNGIGANMSFRRSVLVTTGGFDADLGRRGADAAGCEETEFSIRAHQAAPSARILLEPAAVVRHVVTPERTTRAYFRRRCRAEGRSKALVTALAGPGPALATERAYVTRVLPRGVGEGLLAAARGDLAGAARARAIVEGFTLTAFGYVEVRARLRLRGHAAGVLAQTSSVRAVPVDGAGGTAEAAAAGAPDRAARLRR